MIDIVAAFFLSVTISVSIFCFWDEIKHPCENRLQSNQATTLFGCFATIAVLCLIGLVT